MAAFVLGLFRGDELDRLRERLAATPATPPGEVSPGPVAVEGVAREHRETVESPVGGREALLVQYRRHRSEGDGSPVEERTDAVPFVVEDETGRVLVDPREAVEGDGDGNYAVFSERNTRRHYGGTDPASATPLGGGSEDDESGGTEDPVAADGSTDGDTGAGTPASGGTADGTTLDADRPGVGAAANWRESVPDSASWIHAESAIRPGDTVYVVGVAEETPGGSPPFVVTPDEEGIFLVSDLGPAAVREQLDRESSPLDRSVLSLLALGVIVVLILVGVLAVAYTVADAVAF
jgi:hypothetical protein